MLKQATRGNMNTLMHLLVRFGWIVLLLALVYGYVRYFEWSNLYYPQRSIDATPRDFGVEFESVDFMAEDGVRLHGWWLPVKDARGTLIYCHGNAGNIGTIAWVAVDLTRLGLNVFVFDYRGYGRSQGIPSEQGTYRDARAAYEVVRARHGQTENPPVVVYGHSLGGAIAIQLALDRPVSGLIVESAFTSTAEIGRYFYPYLPVDWICRYRYDSIAKVGRIQVPKLFAHSRADEIVPYELGIRLYGAAAEPKRFVEIKGGHNDVAWTVDGSFWHELTNFIATCNK